MSAKQPTRSLYVSFNSAWVTCHRVRFAKIEEPLLSKLAGDYFQNRLTRLF